MPRTRIHVNERGRPVQTPTGVSYIPSQHRFYIIDSAKQRRYFQTWAEARAAHIAEEQARLTEEQRAIKSARVAVRVAALLDKLATEGRGPEADDIRFEQVAESILLKGQQAFIALQERLSAQADAEGIQDVEVRRVLPKSHRGGPRLSAVLTDWQESKAAVGVGEQHRTETTKRFQAFVDSTKNVCIGDLTPAHFRTFYDRLLSEAEKRKNPNRWFGERAKAILGVLTHVRRRHPSPEWPWPAGVTEWANTFARRPVTSKKENRQPLPPGEFAKLLAAAEKWTRIDVDAMPNETPADFAARGHARDRVRDGFQLGAILQIACNCALANIDITRLRWEQIKLDAKLPHLDLPRLKTEGSVGAIERLTPLLPQTITALRKWQEVEGTGDGLVFRTKRGLPLKPDRLADAFGRLREAAGVSANWKFKHIRNIAPSVGRRHRRHPDEREAVLGHRCSATRAFYEGDFDASYLLPLVELVGQEYFDHGPTEA